MKKEGVEIVIIALVLYHAAVSSGESSAGRKFAIGFPRNSLNDGGPEELSISIANYESSDINFEITALGFSSNGTLFPLTAANVTVPLSFQVASANERNKGILVEATGEVYVHGLSYKSISSDSYLALPCRVMLVNEYEYFAISYDVLPNSLYPATILVVACDDATSVTIGSTLITLNSMDTYLISSGTTDLTGTRITSSKPVSVFSGVDCANVPMNVTYCDHLVEQVPPTVTWGSRFFVSSLNGRNSNQLIRVLSARAATVTVTCNTAISVSQFQLASGDSETFEIPITSYCSIESTGPVLVAQYAYGYSTDNIGDPFMMIIPPTEQYINRHIFETYKSFYSILYSHFTIYVESDFFQSTDIFLNNKVIPNWQPVPCSSERVCGYIARMTVSPGMYRIQHQNTSAVIGVSVYGFTEFISYGMPVGMGLSLIQVPALIQLRLVGVDRCQQWVIEDGRQKLNTLSEALSVNVEERCQCGFSVSNVLNPTFRCFPESENAVTYRAKVSNTVSFSPSQIVNHIDDWLTDGALVTFDFITIPIDSSCRVGLSSNTDPECNGPTTAVVTMTPSFPVAAVGGAVGGVVMLLIVIIFISVAYIWLHIKHTRSFQLTNNMPFEVEMNVWNVAVASSNEKEGEYETIDNFQNVASKLCKYEDVKFPPTTSPSPPPPPPVPEWKFVTARTAVNDTVKKDFDITDCAAYGVTRIY